MKMSSEHKHQTCSAQCAGCAKGSRTNIPLCEESPTDSECPDCGEPLEMAIDLDGTWLRCSDRGCGYQSTETVAQPSSNDQERELRDLPTI